MSEYINDPPIEGGSGTCDFNEGAPSSLRIVRLIATANVASLSGSTTLDGLATNDGDDALLPYQTTLSQCGIYTVNHGGAWTRRADFAAGSNGQVALGTTVVAYDGRDNRYATFRLFTAGAINVGVTSLNFHKVGSDFSQVLGTDGTYSKIGLQQIFIILSGPSATICGQFGAVIDGQSQLSPGSNGFWMGAGLGYKALADTTAWVGLHGGQGKPTGVPANLTTFPGKVAERWDMTNGKRYSFNPENVASWKCSGEEYTALNRGTGLANADQTVQPGTDKASQYNRIIPLTANRNTTVGTTSVPTGMEVDIVRQDGAAFTNAIINGGAGAGTLLTFAASPTTAERLTIRFDGTNWVEPRFRYVEP